MKFRSLLRFRLVDSGRRRGGVCRWRSDGRTVRRPTNGTAYIVPTGELRINGYRMQCGTRATVIDDNLDDYGAAYPGFIILNTKLLLRLPQPVMLWIYSHECGHQFRGPDEETADCFGVQRGRREGWLNEQGLNDVCDFIAAAKGDNMHFAGPHRCEAMRRCFADPAVH